MTRRQKERILERYKEWYRERFIPSHIRNTRKLSNINEFNINPITLHYLAYFLEGNARARSLAKALVYPRALSSSINTSFGMLIQNDFITEVLGSFGSGSEGFDIEFIDPIDRRRKYCQVKAGPNVINKDDVITITDHFRKFKRRARANRLDVRMDDLYFCLVYGEPEEKNTHIRVLERDITVLIGREFWARFTGDEDFYPSLIEASKEVASERSVRRAIKAVVEEVIEELSEQIEERLEELGVG